MPADRDQAARLCRLLIEAFDWLADDQRIWRTRARAPPTLAAEGHPACDQNPAIAVAAADRVHGLALHEVCGGLDADRQGWRRAVAIDGAWPDAMVRELQAVRTVADRIAWETRWSEHLSGRAAQLRAVQPARPGPPIARPPVRRQPR